MTRHDCIPALLTAGITYQDAHQLRRIAMQLDRWHERQMTRYEALVAVLDAARAYADDVESGLEDGTYEEGDPESLRKAIHILEPEIDIGE